MKLKKILSVAMVAAMALSLAACNKTQGTTDDGTLSTYSVDFEDGNCAFVLPCTKTAAYDAATVSVQEVGGTKVAYAATAGGQMVLGVDAASLLGDDITKVAQIQITIGTSHAEGFAATSGTVNAYVGEECKETELGSWSVYLEDQNPKVFTFDMGDAAFTAGNKNYIAIVKSTDNGTTPGDLYIDNIAFIDADGNVLTADTTVSFDPVDGYVGSEEEVAEGTEVIALDTAYPGDWGAGTFILPEQLEAYKDTGVTIKLIFATTGDKDYYLYNPIAMGAVSGGWISLTKDGQNITNLVAGDAVEGEAFHLQADGFIVLDDWDAAYMEFTLAPEGVQMVIDEGGLSGQTWGLTTLEAQLSVPAEGALDGIGENNTSEKPENYLGDWSGNLFVSYDALNADGSTVVVDITALDGFDYYLLKPMDCMDSWNAVTVTCDLEANDEGYLVVTESGEITMTLDADAVAALVEHANSNADGPWGGLGFQVYGVSINSVTVDGTAVYEYVAEADGAAGYAGDWAAVGDGSGVTVSYEQLENAEMAVVLDVAFVDGADQTVLKPMDPNGWAAIEVTCDYEVNDDGFMVLTEAGTVEFTISADVAATLIDNGTAGGWGGLGFQTCGVIVNSITINGNEVTMTE